MKHQNQTPTTHYLKDYTPSVFLIEEIHLHVDLYEEYALVKAILNIHRRDKDTVKHLVLDGEELQLESVFLNGSELNSDQYQVDARSLTVFNVPDHFNLETVVKIEPQKNTQLSGLYKSGQQFCTQCESQGFRRITYFLDRPDVLTHFITTITANRTQYPLLLANGNLVDSQELTGNRHWVKWDDPTLKPCYLFALVAGNLEMLEDTFITQSGRQVQLKIYVEHGKRNQAQHAMSALKQAMAWDEEQYGREYDLDIYMIVAVSDFNFGAMENKGLNIFNDKYILAKPETATDEDFVNVQSVVGHEYFHNWSGNRVTVRDWFQITLKEGLTVFREEQFTADHTSKVVKRIQEVNTIRSAQFAQDASPMAHPIQPDSYMEVNNFYTVTVYEKGAEVIRMLYTILGEQKFRTAMDFYFAQNDGHAVTVEEFIQAMEHALQSDLAQFRRWYHQAGTPLLRIEDEYDDKNNIYTLTVSQSCPPTPGQAHKLPFHIPLAMGLLNASGHELLLQLDNEDAPSDSFTRLLELKQEKETFRFIHIPEKPIPSLLRHFSAPVKLHYDYSDDQLIFLMSSDTDVFNRWDASQQLIVRLLLNLTKQSQKNIPLSVPDHFLSALKKVFIESKEESVVAEIFSLPTLSCLMEEMTVIDTDAIHAAREWLIQKIASHLRQEFIDFYELHKHIRPYSLEPKEIGLRRLKNLVLMYLAYSGDKAILPVCFEQFKQANNMTDVMGAMQALINIESEQRAAVLSLFYHRWHHEYLVVNKWFSLQAQSTLPNTLKVVKNLTQHPAFDQKNPNSVRSLIAAFAAHNPYQFHQSSGEGYVFLVDHILAIDTFNPQLAARMVEPLIRWKKFDSHRQQLMKTQLERIAHTVKVSSNVLEIVSKSL